MDPMRNLLAACAIVALIVAAAPAAHANVDGEMPGPGLCDYPGIGTSNMIMNAYVYTCDFPMEENGSHWHCEYAGGVINGSVGVSIMMFNAGISGFLGAISGSCSWRCPSGALAASAPNPPGAWKNYVSPRKCKEVPPPPPEATPDGAPPADPGNRPLPYNQEPQPAVTNPDNPNPDATANPR